jgi:hypothetical protein
MKPYLSLWPTTETDGLQTYPQAVHLLGKRTVRGILRPANHCRILP